MELSRTEASSTNWKNAVLMFDVLQEAVGREYGAFALVCHVAFDQPPLTRRERAENVRKRDYFTKYGDEARAVLEALLLKYADEGIDHIESMEVLKVQPLSTFGAPIEIVKMFGSKAEYIRALRELEALLHAEAG